MKNNIRDDCIYLENIFIDYINGSLEEKENIFCDNHLKYCDKCKNNQDFKEMIDAWKLMDKWDDIPVSNNFMAKLQHEIVLIEERQRVFWFNIDRIIALFRVPITALFIFMFTLSNNLSYAKAEKEIFFKNTVKVENSIRDYSQKNIEEVFKDIKNILDNKKEI